MRKEVNKSHHNFKGDNVSPKQARTRCRHIPLIRCEKCGAPPIDRHHKDSNTFNNDTANISTLCRKCHMIEDGRMDALKALASLNSQKNIKPKRECSICGALAKPIRKGRCPACADYLWKNGIERPTDTYQGKKPLNKESPCPICSRQTRLKTKGRCVVCYNYLRRTERDRSEFKFKVERIQEKTKRQRKINDSAK